MNKNCYEKPNMEIVVLVSNDVVTASEGDYEYTEQW